MLNTNLSEVLDTAFLHCNRAKNNYTEIQTYTLDADIYKDNEKIKTLDAFIFRFIKLQDFMGDKLFKELLKSLGEYKDNMSLLDVLDKLEKFEVIKQADQWLDYRIIRNKLTHEYPENQQEMLIGIKAALQQFVQIENILKDIQMFAQKKALLK